MPLLRLFGEARSTKDGAQHEVFNIIPLFLHGRDGDAGKAFLRGDGNRAHLA